MKLLPVPRATVPVMYLHKTDTCHWFGKAPARIVRVTARRHFAGTHPRGRVMNLFQQLLSHTPIWVWVLMVSLISRGIAAMKPGETSLPALAIVPAVFTAWGGGHQPPLRRIVVVLGRVAGRHRRRNGPGLAVAAPGACGHEQCDGTAAQRGLQPAAAAADHVPGEVWLRNGARSVARAERERRFQRCLPAVVRWFHRHLHRPLLPVSVGSTP